MIGHLLRQLRKKIDKNRKALQSEKYYCVQKYKHLQKEKKIKKKMCVFFTNITVLID
jgi:hypothetical protein